MKHTPLNRRKKEGRSIRSPFHVLGDKVNWSSWKDDYLPNMLWACVATGSLDRSDYLDLFRDIATRARVKWKDRKGVILSHSALVAVDQQNFEYVFSPLSKSSDRRAIIATVAMLDSLPDKELWRSFAAKSGVPEGSWNVLAQGVARCLDHQSEQSTDIRWLKVICLAICGNLVLPSDKMADNIRLYPDSGDMRSVRPMIRATEMSIRMMEDGPERPSETINFPVEQFWDELFKKTRCEPALSQGHEIKGQKELAIEVHNLAAKLSDHFLASIATTSVDPKLDGTFGLVMYVSHLCVELAILPSNQLSSGRIILRSIVESYLTLHYLATKDDVTLWTQYRNYGTGQSALSYLKTVDLRDGPSYIGIDDLEMLANEDAWFETKDIVVGNWASKNLRSIALECNKKDIYDKYYDLLSSFSHAQWGAVRDTCYTICLNPLHRLHRLPVLGRAKPSVLPDACKLLNLMLEDLNGLYPTFKTRLKWHNRQAKTKQSKADGRR